MQIGGEDHEVVFLSAITTLRAMVAAAPINHRANMRAMEGAKVDAVLSVCSVGAIAASFRQEGHLASQYIDFTGVATTFDDEAVFTSAALPFDPMPTTDWKPFSSTSNPIMADRSATRISWPKGRS